MSVEVFFLPKLVLNEKQEIQKFRTVEPGKPTSHLFYEGEVARLAIACCQSQDICGRLYVVDEKLAKYNEDGTIDLQPQLMNDTDFEIVPAGSAISLHIRPPAHPEGSFLVAHFSPN